MYQPVRHTPARSADLFSTAWLKNSVAFRKPSSVHLFQVKEALQIKLVGFGTFRIVLRDLADGFFSSNDPGTQVVIDLFEMSPCIAMRSEALRLNWSPQSSVPSATLTRSVWMVRVSPRCATLPMSTASTLILADFLRIDLAALVAEHCAASHDPQFGNTRQAADNAFGHSVGKIFDIRVRAHVHEGKNCDGVNVITASQKAVAPTMRKQGGCQ